MPIATTRTWWLFEVNLCTMSHESGYTFLQPPYYQNTLRLLLAQKATFMWRFCWVALIVGCIVLYTWSVWLGIVSTTLASCVFLCCCSIWEVVKSPEFQVSDAAMFGCLHSFGTCNRHTTVTKPLFERLYSRIKNIKNVTRYRDSRSAKHRNKIGMIA